jgi:SAM-dependent MidA family methyltransferase
LVNVEQGREDGPLLAEIVGEIRARGPLTFERFMERALYEPDHGYYATSVTRPSRAGDFLTAPELHPIFGHTLARTLDEMWRGLARPSTFTLREYGAGTGALYEAMQEGLAQIESPLAGAIRYEPVDLPAQLESIREHILAAPPSAAFVGTVIANEFVDALPVHRVICMNDQLRELYVDWRDERLVEVAGPLTDERLDRSFTQAGVSLAEGHRAEVNLRMLDWVDEVASSLNRGFVIVIDYGATTADLYDGSRPTGTIRAFSGNRVSADVLSEPGMRDITAHVDFDALERQARAAGLDVVGRRRANEFLVASGLDDAYAAARAAAETSQDFEAALTLRSTIQRLLDPNALGGYLVSVLGKDVPSEPPLRGFAPLAKR